LHRQFKDRRLNWVNDRKEFFKVTLEEIELAAKSLGHEVEFMKIVEARDYRETLARVEYFLQSGKEVVVESKFPEVLFDEDNVLELDPNE
jgi:hypothetical protein